jgi:hypothetical protein
VPRYIFQGDHEQTYPQYLDVAKGSTLVAEPGQAYEIAQAEGLTVPGEPDEDGGTQPVEVALAMPPDGRWTAEQSRTRAGRRDTTTDTTGES